MDRKALGPMRTVVGGAGLALVVAPFLPWADGQSAWDLEPAIAVVCLLAGAAALAAAATDGQVGFFRPDVSSSGAADLLNVAAMAAVAVFVLFDGAGPEAGAYLALASAAVAACGSADWRPLRGAPLFPR